MTTERLREDLVATRALIDMPEKWCLRNTGEETFPLSLARAMHLSLKGASGPDYFNRYGAMRRAIEAARNSPFSWEAWSQHPRTTHADVLDVLNIAIERVSI